MPNNNDPEFLNKLAADAVRLVGPLKKENEDLKAKLAKYEKKERAQKIARQLYEKKQIGEHEIFKKEADLQDLTDSDLDRIEAGLSIISPSGSIALGEVEQSGQGAPENRSGETGLHRLLLHGLGDSPES